MHEVPCIRYFTKSLVQSSAQHACNIFVDSTSGDTPQHGTGVQPDSRNAAYGGKYTNDNRANYWNSQGRLELTNNIPMTHSRGSITCVELLIMGPCPCVALPSSDMAVPLEMTLKSNGVKVGWGHYGGLYKPYLFKIDTWTKINFPSYHRDCFQEKHHLDFWKLLHH